MTSGAVKFATTMACAILVMFFVFGVAYELQKHWSHAWMACVASLLGVLLILLSVRESAAVELGVQKSLERYCGRQKSSAGKNKPIYGDPTDTGRLTGDDRPLPNSLRSRVDAYIKRRRASNPDQFDKDVAAASSFNALIRREYWAGKL